LVDEGVTVEGHLIYRSGVAATATESVATGTVTDGLYAGYAAPTTGTATANSL
jgi:hypothetical protein